MAKRIVQFWRINQVNGDELTRPFPGRRVAEVVKAAEEREADRHFVCPDGTRLLANSLALSPHPVILLDRVRDSNLPAVGDSAGHRKALPLRPGDHLLETTFFAFLSQNVIAVLASGNGPRVSRLADYLEGMLGLRLGLVPVLREDVEEILTRLEVSRFEFALPAERLSGRLMEGEWADVLDSASRLMTEGTFRISLSVGRTGKAEDKQRIRKRIQRLIDSFRSSASVEQFDYVAAEGKDTLTGDREVVDLLKERFIAQVDVDADVFNDPSRSAAEAIAILARQAQENEAFFRRTLPGITGSPDNSSVSEIIEDGAQAVSAAIGKMACEPVVTEAGKDVRPRAGIEASDVLVRG